MKKVLIVLIGLFTISSTFGQKEVNNSRTSNHKQIAGTKFFIIPPSGFVGATTFQGFQQSSSKSSILVMEIPGPFTEISKGLNEQGLKTQGVILKKKEAIKVNGQQGFLIGSEQFANGINYSKYNLVFGDTKATQMITGMFPKEIIELDKQVRESILTVVYESQLEVDPLGATSFTVDTENTKLKFAKSMSGMLLYSVDGKVPTESNDRTSFIAGLSFANVQTIDKKLTAINRFKKLPYDDLKADEKKINQIEIDGISGYEITGEGLDPSDGTKELIYQVMLFSDNGYYLLLGTAKNEFEKNLELFKKVAKSLKRK